ncbi:MAG: glycoside hydrolase family 32 protein [Bacteroidetes bacterium]|nr:glycoside hydrolase family 32 protein [Bacteroidota bacterium]
MKKNLIGYLLFFFLWKGSLAQDQQVPTPQWRSVYHFTPAKNWTNDPNGLIYLNGEFHLYNQQNPFENKWGHMSWGHATSTDLIHWKHLPIAIPEIINGTDTIWRFSGCAVWDANNSSGFCEKDGCLVAVYTAHQPYQKKESQFISYSNDGGLTFTDYSKNPVIDLQKRDFRDPNVTWNEELKKWVMVVVLPAEHKALFYASTNLKEWDLLSEFGNAGFVDGYWECPALIQLNVDGEPGKKKWVLLISAGGRKRGTYMHYFVGDFEKGVFKNDSPADTILTVDGGDSFYAAIPWNGVPDNKKILIGWMVPGDQPTYPWRGQMSIPRDLSVRNTKNGYRLVQTPTSLIEKNLDHFSSEVIKKNGMQIANAEKELQSIPGNAFWLDATVSIKQGTDFGFKIGRKKGKDGKTTATVIGYNGSSRALYVDKTLSANSKNKKTFLSESADGVVKNNSLRIQILFDKSSLEVFLNDGEKVITTYIFPDADANGLSVFAKNGSATINSLTVRDLSKNKQD